MKDQIGKHIGTVVGNTSPQEFSFYLKSYSAKLGDLVCVEMQIPTEQERKEDVIVWGRIVELKRYNPFLPSEAGLELADEGLELIDTVLSNSRDQIEGTVLVLGRTSKNDLAKLYPLNYPVHPGAEVRLPPNSAVQTILTGNEETHRINIGTLIGRRDVDVSLKTNFVVARHMAILAMTGGGKTVAARRIIKELLNCNYPMVIFDPHGDYLGFWQKSALFPNNKIKLYYPHLKVNENNRDLIGYLVGQMTQGFTEAQREVFQNTMEKIKLNENEDVPINNFLEKLINGTSAAQTQSKWTIPVVQRGLRFVRTQMEAMELSNKRLRDTLPDFPFEPMPDPKTQPEYFIEPGLASIIYLGGYDHLTQSTIVSIILKNLFDERASMRNKIPPLLTIIEEAHNFIPSKGEGQAETPSVEIIRKVITEGRKFGVGLLLISQRPSRLDETTLSQCNTFLVFRLVNPKDQSFVEKVMENLTKADSKLLPGFGPGQGIVSGQAVRFPLVIQTGFDRELISNAIGDENFVDAVQKWSSSPHAEIIRKSKEMEKELDEALKKHN